MGFRYNGQYSRAEHSERTRMGQHKARLEGRVGGFVSAAAQCAAMQKACVANKEAARQRALAFAELAKELHQQGITSIQGMARELNRRQQRTPSGGTWTRLIIRQMLQRAKQS